MTTLRTALSVMVVIDDGYTPKPHLPAPRRELKKGFLFVGSDVGQGAPIVKDCNLCTHSGDGFLAPSQPFCRCYARHEVVRLFTTCNQVEVVILFGQQLQRFL